jgi:hypothetical protein
LRNLSIARGSDCRGTRSDASRFFGTVASGGGICCNLDVKALRIAGIILAGLFLLLVLLIALLFIPAVQKALVTRVASGPDGTLEVDYLRIRPNSITLRNAVFTQPDGSYTVAEFRADLSLSDVIFRRELRIGELVATGVLLDIVELVQREREEPDEEPDEPFEGILRQMELPMPVHLGRVEVEGRVLLPGAGDQPAESRFFLNGGGLAPGAEGDFRLAGEFADSSPQAAIGRIDFDGNVRVRQAGGGAIERLDLVLQLAAAGGPLEVEDRLRVTATLAAVDAGESYVAEVHRGSDAGAVPLLSLTGGYDETERVLRANWDLQVNREQLAAFAATADLPDFVSRSSGEVTHFAASGATGLAGQLHISAEHLGALAEELRELGGFTFESRFDAAFGESEIVLTQLSAQLTNREGQVLLDAASSSIVRYDLEQERLTGVSDGVELLSISLQNLPVEWANLFLQADDPAEEWVVEGGTVHGRLLFSAQDAGISFQLAEPLRANGISVRQGEDRLLQGVAFEARASGALRDGVLRAVLDQLVVSGDGQEMLQVFGDFDGATDQLQVRVEANLPAISAQPMLAEIGAATGGRLVIDLTAVLAEPANYAVRGSLTEVVWDQLPDLVLGGDFDLAISRHFVRIENLVAFVRDQGGRSFLEARNYQPIIYDLETEQLAGIEAGVDLLTVALTELPLTLANLFLAAEEDPEALRVEAGLASGQVLLRAEGTAVAIQLVEPLRGRGIALTSGGEPMLQQVDFQMTGSGSLRDGEVIFDLNDLQVFGAGREMMRITGRYDSSAAQVGATVLASLPVVLSQPFLADLNNASAGTVSIDLNARLSSPARVELAGTVSGVRLRRERERVADLQLRATATEVVENEWEVEIPVQIAGAQPSDLRLAGRVVLGEVVNQFNLQLVSSFLRMEDLTQLAAAFASDPAADTGSAPDAEDRDEEPFWSGFRGAIAIEIAELRLPGEHPMHRLQGNLTMAEESVVMDLAGGLLDSPVSVEGEIQYLGQNQRPYLLQGLLEAPRLSAAHFFQQAQPRRPPTVEGIFAASGTLQGDGQNLGELVDRVRGQFRLQAGEGVFRLFYTENALAGLGLAVGGLAGGLLGTVSPEAGAVMEVARLLSNVRFNELNLLLERDEDLNFLLRDLTLVSPELHLQGVGEVRHRAGIAVLQQPMNIQLRLGAQESLERVLGAVRILGDQRDDLGYRLMRQEFNITGTPANPDNSTFYRLILNTALQFLSPRNNGRQEEAREEREPSPVQGVLEGLDGIFRRR